MSVGIGQKERLTQDRVVKLFESQLGYRYLGNRKDLIGNSNVDEDALRDWLRGQGHADDLITRVLGELRRAATVGGHVSLYDANRAVYTLLRYGVQVAPTHGEGKITVSLIDWERPDLNDFAVAEEVSIVGVNSKRPDVALYVNGIALGVLELKRSIVSVAEGIRQNLDSQSPEFIRPFFATVQLVFAGSDSEGLRYAVIGTREKHHLTWKEPGKPENPLDRGLLQLCGKERFLELIHDFIVFDAGAKKIARHNQYFGVRACQDHVRRREGGIIWHTQGSGKSLTMVWLARWIMENVPDSRVAIITDRTELDRQIQKIFLGVDEQIYRTKSGADLVSVLNAHNPALICSLVHKFGTSDEDGDVDDFIADIRSHLPKDFHPKGDLFVFVDECHRTQSGKLHEAMKAILPGAMFIGFTGTPLLKSDKQRSIEVFGPYIHTYKYDEAVRDGAVLDLRYEARDIDQSITSQAKVDQWFSLKTQGLSDVAKAQLKQRWGTMQHVLSSEDRLARIVDDILLDMEIRDRLKSGQGNALLVCASIYQACRLYEMFQKTDLADRCAIITSYKPSVSSIKGEDSGEGETEKLLQYDVYRKMLAKHFGESEESAVGKIERFEEDVKTKFVEQPAQMKLLIVVDKLLTGFDAPPATYLYIDKQMRDHALFQAICRVNRLDSDDKEYGYIIDYKDLFKSLERSIKDYTGEAFDGYDASDVKGLLKDRLEQGRDRLNGVREELKALCEPVDPPRTEPEYIRFFCSQDFEDADTVAADERRRILLYKLVASYLRAYANIANEMDAAGYTPAMAIKKEVEHFEKVREVVKLASGDYIDMKMFEPAMRHLLDSYIHAEDSVKVSVFDDMTLVDLLVSRGKAGLDALPPGIRKNKNALAETIENNIRTVIIDASPVNPKYYETMSALLTALIKRRREEALDYQEYLNEVVELAKKAASPEEGQSYPSTINSPSRRALYDNLDADEGAALKVDEAIRKSKREDWRSHPVKLREVRNAIRRALGDRAEQTDAVLELAKNQHDY